jgi:RND family efflux transporter MFP subunit
MSPARRLCGLAVVVALAACGRHEAPPPAASPGASGAASPATGSAPGAASSPARDAAPRTASGPARADSPPAAPGEPGAVPAGPPVAVTAVPAEQRDMPITVEATGTVVAVSSIEIRPQLSSVVTAVHVREGQFVEAGEPLFTLDARADAANVAKLRAQARSDETALADLRRQLERNRELQRKGFVSQAVVESSQAQVDAQVAAVAANRAAIDAAQVPVGYARIVAPSAGRVGAVGVWPGSAVVANQTTLVTVTRIDPIDVAFSVPQRHLQEVLAALETGRATVSATLPDGGTALQGRLVFVDNAIDAGSGTVRVKARFDNSPSTLWPGAFVRASLELGAIEDAVVVPQASLIRGPRTTFVYVVEQGRAVQRTVEVVGSRGDDAAVRGVRAGEAVVLDGRQNLRPGAPVTVRPSAPGGGAPGGTGTPNDRGTAP